MNRIQPALSPRHTSSPTIKPPCTKPKLCSVFECSLGLKIAPPETNILSKFPEIDKRLNNKYQACFQLATQLELSENKDTFIPRDKETTKRLFFNNKSTCYVKILYTPSPNQSDKSISYQPLFNSDETLIHQFTCSNETLISKPDSWLFKGIQQLISEFETK